MTTKSSGSRKHGRASRKPGHKRYAAGNRRFENKLERVRRSSGEKAAAEYSATYRYRQRVGKKRPPADEFITRGENDAGSPI